MLRKRRVASWSIVVTLLLAPVASGAQSPAPTTPTWQDEVRAMLARRAQAVERGDQKAFEATMVGAPKQFRQERLNWFERIQTLPLGGYALDFSQEEFSELTRDVDRRQHRGEVHVIQVKERIAFEGYDTAPSAEDLFLTVARSDAGWNVVADDDAEPLALQSMRHLWDFGPVSHVEDDGVMIVFHPTERAAASSLLSASKAARQTVKNRWPFRWRQDRVIVMIPSTVDELARMLQTTFDLSTFVAFAGASVERSKGWGLTGKRVYLHWPNFRGYSAGFQRTILEHEFLHLATFEMNTQYITSIMDEGAAQYYGEAAYDPPTPELRASVRSGRFNHHLADDFIFTAGTPAEIYSSYEQANHFMAYLGNRFERNAGARLYRELGTQSTVAPGTWRYHLDRACRSVLGLPFATLERDWARRVVQELS